MVKKEKIGARDRVVRTAARLFYDQGYGATGINQIIEEAGIAKASLYQLFRSKDDLLVEYLRQYCSTWKKDFEVFRDGLPDGKKSLLALFDFRIVHIRENQYKGCGLIRVSYELPMLEGAAADIVKQFKLFIKAYIHTHVKAGDASLGRQEITDLTETIYNFYEGSGTQAYVFKSIKPVEDAKRIIQKFIP